MKYISANSCISAQNTFAESEWNQNIHIPKNGVLSCIDPDYKIFIDAKMLRRMSRIQRMGLSAALQCLKNSGIEKPDAIVCGTGWGCIESTYTFLNKIFGLQNQEASPAVFIQSTHNTIAAQIALQLSCRGYNNTLTDNDFAFELALDDALIAMDDDALQNVLVGGIDELTFELTDILEKIAKPNKLAVLGEGSSFFLVSDKSNDTTLEIKHFSIQRIDKEDNLLQDLIGRNNISFILSGENENQTYSQLQDLRDAHLQEVILFKRLSGTYPSAMAFGLWLATDCLQRNLNPKTLNISSDKIDNMLIYTQSKNGLSCVLVIGR